KEVIAAFMKSRTKAELFAIARENNLLIAPVATIEDVRANPQFIARDYWQRVEHPSSASLIYPGPFARFSATPITYRRRAAIICEHNREIVRGELKMREGEIAALAQRGII